MHNVEHDVSAIEFAKYDPGNLKYQSDRCKLLIEGKNIINMLIDNFVDVSSVPVVQVCGTELHLLEVSLVAPGLYIGNQRCSFSLLNTWDSFIMFPKMIECLLRFRNEYTEIGDLLKDSLITIENTKGSTSGPKYQKKKSPVVNSKKNWTRKNWVVFREKKYSKNSIPAPPF